MGGEDNRFYETLPRALRVAALLHFHGSFIGTLGGRLNPRVHQRARRTEGRYLRSPVPTLDVRTPCRRDNLQGGTCRASSAGCPVVTAPGRRRSRRLSSAVIVTDMFAIYTGLGPLWARGALPTTGLQIRAFSPQSGSLSIGTWYFAAIGPKDSGHGLPGRCPPRLPPHATERVPERRRAPDAPRHEAAGPCYVRLLGVRACWRC